MPGPVPNRSDQRRRRNKPEGVQVAKVAAGRVPAVPAADAEWHPIARDWFLSLQTSGQSKFYEASDWQTARVLAEVLSVVLSGRSADGAYRRVPAQLFQSWLSGTTDLLTTEGARRRARIELERADDSREVPAGVAIMDAYRDAAK